MRATTLTYVRTGDGDVVAVAEGEAVPTEADPDHVAELTDLGVLAADTTTASTADTTGTSTAVGTADSGDTSAPSAATGTTSTPSTGTTPTEGGPKRRTQGG